MIMLIIVLIMKLITKVSFIQYKHEIYINWKMINKTIDDEANLTSVFVFGETINEK